MHEIMISELFCSYMWCLSYYSLLKYESIAQQNPEVKIHENNYITDEMFCRAANLLEWSFSQQDIEKKWDYLNISSPFPTCNLFDSEYYYSSKANVIYIHSIMACLFHEVGHAATLPKLPIEQSEEDRKESEKTADNFMFELMFKELGNENSFSISLGITVAYLGILIRTRL